MKFLITFLMATVFSGFAFAGQAYYDSTDKHVGVFSETKCGPNLSCTQVSSQLYLDVEQNQIDSSNTTLTATQCGATVLGVDTHTVNLPEASGVLGCRFTFGLASSSTLTINPDDADQILLITNAAGDAISADAPGESVVLEAISASQWMPVGAEKGTWTDAN